MEKVFPKQIGSFVELQCITRLAELGCVISTPIGEFARYDFIIDLESHLYKIQCKNWSYGATNGTIKFNTSTSHISRMKGNVKRKYTKLEIDFFCTFYDGECYLFPIEECNGYKKCLTIDGKDPRQTLLSDYKASKILGLKEGVTIYDLLAEDRWKRTISRNNVCCKCGKNVSNGTSLCRRCREDSRRPSKDRLEKMIANKPLKVILCELHINRTTLIRWLKEYEINKEKFVKRGRKVKGCNRYSIDGTLEKSYHDYYEVEQDGYSKKEVQRCCLHQRKTYKGKVWEYHNDFIAG